VIIAHVLKGEEIAKKHGLHEKIIDFIRTHHGTGTVQYFYRTYINTNPDEEVDIDEFTYPGPKPSSKENAVLMMADSVEAASRTLKAYTRESISELVENIVSRQAEEEQFSEADITFAELTTIKEIFKNRLTNIYHSRIAYPE
jgi:cyclic-di-AMP phosphodiesterase PgpH